MRWNRDRSPERATRVGMNSFDEAMRVQQVLARYVRATDARNGCAMARLFVGDGRLEIFHRRNGVPSLLAAIHGAQAIGRAVDDTSIPRAERGWSHHTTHDCIVRVDGDEARLDAQFVVFETLGHEEPAAGWPCDAIGAQGVVRPTDAGYLCAWLRNVDDTWKIATMRVVHDLPFARRGAGVGHG
jgi:hypothetical protein